MPLSDFFSDTYFRSGRTSTQVPIGDNAGNVGRGTSDPYNRGSKTSTDSLEREKYLLLSQYKELSDPYSAYYQKIRKDISNQVTGALSPNSLYGIIAAMGGSPAQAEAKIKQIQAQVPALTDQLFNQYYTNMATQAINVLDTIIKTDLTQQELALKKQELELMKQQQEQSFWGDIIGAIGSIGGVIAGTLLAPATGGASLPLLAGLGYTLGSSAAPTPTFSGGLTSMYLNRYGKFPGIGGY